MILSFSTKFKNGKPTLFFRKIWVGIILFTICDVSEWDAYMCKHWDKFKRNPDDELNEVSPKIHTIRIDSKNRWRPGKNIHFFIYPRSPNMFQFAPVLPCVSVQKIEISKYHSAFNTTVKVDCKELAPDVLFRLIKNDGFDTPEQFFEYFKEGFKGVIIHWTNLKY